VGYVGYLPDWKQHQQHGTCTGVRTPRGSRADCYAGETFGMRLNGEEATKVWFTRPDQILKTTRVDGIGEHLSGHTLMV